MTKQKLLIEKEVAVDLAYGEYDDTIFEIISNKIIDVSRWSYRKEIIVKTLIDGRFWKSSYSKGATESQDEGPYDYSDPIFEEVFPEQVMITIYK